MGSQIVFFINDIDLEMICSKIYSDGDELIDDKGNNLQNDRIIPVVQQGYGINLFIRRKNSNIICTENNFVNPLFSEVIEFSIHRVFKNTLDPSRFWYEKKYFDANNTLVEKDGWLSEKYKFYSNWIRRAFRKSHKLSGYYYIGPSAYEEYRSGKIKTMAGPKLEAIFD